MRRDQEIVIGSGNIFADLKVENADEELAKAELAYKIRRLILARGLIQEEAAQLLGVDQSDVSKIMNCKVGKFTYDRLLRCIQRLECNVRIIVEEPNADHSCGKVLVSA